jgi:hypothetical protein
VGLDRCKVLGPSVPWLLTPTEQKEAVKQETVAELMVGILTKHELLATKKEVVTTEADFEDRSLVPYFYGNPQGKLCTQGVTKRCRLSLLTNSALGIRGEGGSCEVSANEYSVTWSPNKL